MLSKRRIWINGWREERESEGGEIEREGGEIERREGEKEEEEEGSPLVSALCPHLNDSQGSFKPQALLTMLRRKSRCSQEIIFPVKPFKLKH